MNWLQSIIYGFVSGLTEFIPVSSRAHQRIFLELFGQTTSHPLLDLFVHIAILLSLFRYANNIRNPFTAQRRPSTGLIGYELRFVKSATIPMLVLFVVFTYLLRNANSLLMISVFLLLNGIILFIPDRIAHGNKDARMMSAFDGVLTGLFGSLFAFPGISRVAASTSISSLRGASRQHGINWALSLAIPALAIVILVDIFHLFVSFQPMTFVDVIWYIFAAISAFFGTFVGIRFLQRICSHTGVSVFSYYSWGAALFAFVLYLL